MIAITILAAIIALWLLLPTIADLLNVVAASRSAKPAGAALPGRTRFHVLVPAHNEAEVILACLEELQRQDYANYAVTVIADNCSDATAAMARSAGAQCLERHDLTRTGKPHAISWALGSIDLSASDAIVIVDADCEVAPDFLRELATAGAAADVAVQPYNGVSNPGANSLTLMAAVLSEALHGIAFRLKARAGRNVPLSAGMCVGTDIIRSQGWQSFSVGEDWETYARLTVQGIPILSASAARLGALEAANLREGASQRRRWTLGKLWVLRNFWKQILKSKRIAIGAKVDAIAELAQPGPALQLGIVVILCALLFITQPPGWMVLSGLIAASLIRFAVFTAAAISRQRQPLRTLLSFGFLPVYVAWRLIAAARHLLGRGGGAWVRTGRESARSRANAA